MHDNLILIPAAAGPLGWPSVTPPCWRSSPCAVAACARRRSCFARHIDNSRLVKAPDPVRVRQMRIFSAAVTVLFSLVMIYGLQHFSAIEGSYRVESEKQVRDQLREENRQLRLAEAQLTQPGRIDGMARQLGLAEPQPGQVVHAATRIRIRALPCLRKSLPLAPASAVAQSRA